VVFWFYNLFSDFEESVKRFWFGLVWFGWFGLVGLVWFVWFVIYIICL